MSYGCIAYESSGAINHDTGALFIEKNEFKYRSNGQNTTVVMSTTKIPGGQWSTVDVLFHYNEDKAPTKAGLENGAIDSYSVALNGSILYTVTSDMLPVYIKDIDFFYFTI